MNKKAMIRMLIDIAMTVVLFFSMSFQFMEQMNHEIFGAILLTLFILHHIMNWRWYVNLGKGKYTGTRILTTVIDFIILIDMFALMFSGMRMSGYVFKWMHLQYSMELARTIHMTASHGGFLLLGIHIGLHYGMIRGMFRKMFKIKGRNLYRTWILRGIGGAVCAYGAYALMKRQFFDYIFGQLHFLVFDYSEPAVFFELDLAAIMILMIAAGYWLQRLVIYIGKLD
ncbi:MAG: DUF4405 domain-containing protein [Lachnospiraceae bacterium]|nr:DUF4405 domain-containing protein [Lachnospiraceae bacterium]